MLKLYIIEIHKDGGEKWTMPKWFRSEWLRAKYMTALRNRHPDEQFRSILYRY